MFLYKVKKPGISHSAIEKICSGFLKCRIENFEVSNRNFRWKIFDCPRWQDNKRIYESFSNSEASEVHK